MNLDHSFVNTDLLRESAKKYLDKGYYTSAPTGGKEYYDFWNREYERCRNGYSVGGIKITGEHYFYLNYSRIQLIDHAHGKSAKRKESFPRFYDGDYNYFWAKKIAKDGISQEELDDLHLAFTPLDIGGGKHLVVLKARRKGYSYKAASILARNFHTSRNTRGWCYAHLKDFLEGDGLLSKAWNIIDFCNDKTAFAQPLLKDSSLERKSGYKEKVGGTYVEKGTKNSIIGISTHGDAGKTRGNAGENIFFEEAGKYPELIDAWEIAKPSVTQGKYTVGTMVAYGTGGTENADYEALEELFYRPESYDVLPLMNIWDEGMEQHSCGFFVPGYVNREGYMDEDGNSDTEEATKAILEKRRIKKESNSSPQAIRQNISQHPLNAREALLRVSSNIFPVELLQEQLNYVISKGLHHSMAAGKLYRNVKGFVKFKVKEGVNPVFSFPLSPGAEKGGAVVIKEGPYRKEGYVPEGMYYIAHDPYKHDGSPDGGSLGSTYVIKRANNISKTLNGCIVASYNGRPPTVDEYNEQLFMLAEYYNCKIGFENNIGDVSSFAKRYKLQHLLERKFDVLESKDNRSSRRTVRNYGIHINEERKRTGELYIRDWLNTVIDVRPDGSKKLILHTILDTALLEELLKFNYEGNFDRVSALIIAMYYKNELQFKDREVKSTKNEASKKLKKFHNNAWAT
jgi:hypothetical protein